jgi:hypothetical protein
MSMKLSFLFELLAWARNILHLFPKKRHIEVFLHDEDGRPRSDLVLRLPDGPRISFDHMGRAFASRHLLGANVSIFATDGRKLLDVILEEDPSGLVSVLVPDGC